MLTLTGMCQGLLILFYNAKMDGIETVLFKFLNENLPAFISSIGTFPDTNNDWFASVGDKIFNQCLTQSIVPNLSMMAKWPQEVIKQNLLKNRMLTQKKLNKLFEVRALPVCFLCSSFCAQTEH